ncbi:ferritin-like domain-containing protein [Flavisolibacter sp. BT320]|nr:ferritin-like domain-containing protein [Flavisolibacter longurius]
MNVANVITEIEKIDPEVYDRLDGRRSALKQFTNLGGKIALATLPLFLSSLFRKAYGQSTGSIVAVLNFALTLEYLESEFYKKAVGTAGLIPAADLPGLTAIRDHEVAHVAALRQTITQLGGAPVTLTAAAFDFTAGNGSMNGPYATVFSNYDTLLAVSQAFEDTGVRAYKGQAGNLMSNNEVLTAALQIHSVEARHAAYIRYLRQKRGAAANKPWITGNDAGGIPGVAAIYAGEETATQAGVPITGINGMNISANAATESFDEPLTQALVTAIVDPFII